jgi:hypothetical protein
MSEVKKDSTDVTRYIMLVDSTAGTPETGYTIANLDLQYTRERSEPAAKVDATALAATNSAHGDNKAIEIDSTSSPGLYRVDWPDAAFATGADKVILCVTGSGLHPAVEEVQLVDYDPEDGVRLGLTALPNAAADANNGIVTGDGSVTFTAGVGNRPAVTNQSVGYANGSIWVDTNASNTNTVDYVDGVADNPVSTWAAALTLSASLGIKRFEIANGSSIQLTANSDNYTMLGQEWSLDLNGQSIAGMFVIHSNISGVGTGTSYKFMMCKIALSSSISLAAGGMKSCAIGDAGVTLTSAGTYLWDECFSGVAGTGTPYVDFEDAAENKNLNLRHYSGGIEVKNIGQASSTDNMSLEGHGQLVLNTNCAGGTIAIRGHFTVTDNASGVVTLSDDARYDVDQINAQCDTALTDYDAATGTEIAAVQSVVDGTDINVNLILVDTGTTIPATLATAQADLDTLTGSDGATLATTQGNYAPATAAALSTHDGKLDTVDGIVDAILLDTGTDGVVIGSAQSVATVTGNVDGSVLGGGAGSITGVGAHVLDYQGNPTATQSDLNLVKADTNELQQDWVNGGRLDLLLDAVATPADVNAQVLDVLNVDTFAEPSSVPAATASIVAMVHWVYSLSRNKGTQTATTKTLRNDADGADIGSATVSDDGTTFQRTGWTT